ncbi:hypothetical protein E2C01_049728 [Portunus trituberculatus]|uniref:Uncharacterized protein n=1 Tax=Portunus trituberculatus TaxID=210409 RepID=A0A5B7GGV2_PORTR|nr:hypothetical protein [Portunus trituberculatus]
MTVHMVVVTVVGCLRPVVFLWGAGIIADVSVPEDSRTEVLYQDSLVRSRSPVVISFTPAGADGGAPSLSLTASDFTPEGMNGIYSVQHDSLESVVFIYPHLVMKVHKRPALHLLLVERVGIAILKDLPK